MTTTHFVQIKDTPIRLRYFPAFADLIVDVETKDGLVSISLDVEMFEESVQEFAQTYQRIHERPLIEGLSPAERLQEPPKEDKTIAFMGTALLALSFVSLALAFYMVFK